MVKFSKLKNANLRTDSRPVMKSMRFLLAVWAVVATHSSLAQEQSALAAIRAACAADAQRLCAGVQQGGGRIVACLKEHKDSLSDGCKQAAGAAAGRGQTAVPTTSSPDLGAATDTPAPTGAAQPTPASKAASNKGAPTKGSSAK